jgi:hypothetical protein
VRAHTYASLICLASLGGVILAPGLALAATPVVLGGVSAPEDMEPLPGGRALLLSEFRLPGSNRMSRLAVLDTRTGAVTSATLRSATHAAKRWGTPGCLAPDPSPSWGGISLTRTAREGWRLLAVNQGSRTSIEAFALAMRGTNLTLTWQGCAVLPANQHPNDVAGLPDGGFVVSIIGDERHFSAPDGLTRLLSGEVTGYLLAYTQADGFRRLPGTDAATPNGVVVAQGGRQLAFASWTGRAVIAYDLRREQVTGRVALPFSPDNLSLTPRGTVLATGVPSVAYVPACLGSGGVGAMCESPFSVVEVGLRADAGGALPMTPRIDAPAGVINGATIAVELGRALYVGAFTGEHLVKYAQ